MGKKKDIFRKSGQDRQAAAMVCLLLTFYLVFHRRILDLDNSLDFYPGYLLLCGDEE
jgi:hypothetical protein